MNLGRKKFEYIKDNIINPEDDATLIEISL